MLYLYYMYKLYVYYHHSFLYFRVKQSGTTEARMKVTFAENLKLYQEFFS